ncbi:MAG: hypothetical protein AAGJ53_06195, partial [Pseudomonadota bacterium]
EIELEALDTSKIIADAGAATVALAYGRDGGVFSAAIGASISENDIDNTITAIVDGATTTVESATGAVSLAATSTATVDTFTLAAAISVAAGSGGSADNAIANTIEASIQGQATVAAAGDISLTARDISRITADVSGGSLGLSLGTEKGLALSVGVSLADNTVNNSVLAFIDDADVGTSGGNLAIAAHSDVEIDATSVAVAVSVAIAQDLGVALSGGGADATNTILGKTNAYIQDSEITNVGNVMLTAENTSKIDAKVVGIAASVGAGGDAGGAAAIGAAVARNNVGWSTGGTPRPLEVRAYLQDSSLQARGNLNQTATLAVKIDSGVGAGAIAIAASSSAALSAAGSGVSTTNRIATNVGATIDGDGTGANAGIKAANITLNADDISEIRAIAGAVSIAAAIVPGGNAGLSLSIGASLARNVTLNTVEAAIVGADDGVTAIGQIVVDADEEAIVKARSVAVSVAATVVLSEKSVGLSLSGAGAEGTNVIGNKVSAHITDSTVTTLGVDYDYTVYDTVDSLKPGDRVRLANGDVLEFIYPWALPFPYPNVNLLDYSFLWQPVESVAGPIEVNANSRATVDAVIGGVAVAGTVAAVGAAGALGVALSRNVIGLGSTDDYSGLKQWLDSSADYSNQVVAHISNSEIESAGNVEVKATQEDDIEAVSFSGAVAVAVSVGAAVAGSGAETSNEFDSDVFAYLSDTNVRAADDILVEAIADSEVTKARSIGTA